MALSVCAYLVFVLSLVLLTSAWDERQTFQIKVQTEVLQRGSLLLPSARLPPFVLE